MIRYNVDGIMDAVRFRYFGAHSTRERLKVAPKTNALCDVVNPDSRQHKLVLLYRKRTIKNCSIVKDGLSFPLLWWKKFVLFGTTIQRLFLFCCGKNSSFSVQRFNGTSSANFFCRSCSFGSTARLAFCSMRCL
jgi:hypothetical protein